MTNSEILKRGILLDLYVKLKQNDFVTVRGEKTVEVMNWTEEFNSDNGIIHITDSFKTSENYIEHETKWYESQNPHNGYIKEYAKIWSTASDKRGMTNSNYGYLIYSPQNGYQYDNVIKTLKEDPYSRRAIMYYTNPMMHFIGGNDHVCTQYVSYSVRKGVLNAYVSMRSNDVRFGLTGADLEWQIHVLNSVASELDMQPGKVHWHAVSIHLYERHFDQLKQIFEGDK